MRAPSHLLPGGAQVHRGDLTDLESLRSGAAAADGVIHTGFNHDFSRFAENCEIDKRAIEVLGSALAGSDRPLIVTSGLAVQRRGPLATEEDVHNSSFPRKSEEVGLAFVSRGVRSSVIRLSPSVHGKGDHGFVPTLISIAREKGVSAYIGEGRNRWVAVHRLDAAYLFRLVIEKGTAGGHYHGVADQGVPTRESAEVIGRHLNIPVVSKSREEATDHFGWIGPFFGMDLPASSTQTQERLRWQPIQPGLIEDLDADHYFESVLGHALSHS